MKTNLFDNTEQLIAARNLDAILLQEIILHINQQNEKVNTFLSQQNNIELLRELSVNEEKYNRGYEHYFYILYEIVREIVLVNNSIIPKILKTEYGFDENQLKWLVNLEDLLKTAKKANQCDNYFFPITSIIPVAYIHLQSKLFLSFQERFYSKVNYNNRAVTRIGKEANRLMRNSKYTTKGNYKKRENADKQLLDIIDDNDGIFIENTNLCYSDFIEGKTEKIIKEEFRKLPYINMEGILPSKMTTNSHIFDFLKILLPDDNSFLDEEDYFTSSFYSSSCSYESYKSKKVNSFLK